MKRLVERLMTTCWLLAILSAPVRSRARAEDEEPEPAEADASLEAEGSEEHEHGGHEHGEHEHDRLRFGLDAVIGFGQIEAATPGVPSLPGTIAPTLFAPADVTSTSFIVGASYELVEGFGVGARLPFALGSFESAEVGSRSAVALGNVELEAEYEAELAPGLELIVALGLALPTGGGEEPPEVEAVEPAEVPEAPESLDDYDAYAILRAAASSRGFEDNALFESKHFGIIPKVGLDYETGAFGMQLYVKLENLLNTASEAEKSYIGELVFGVAAGYEITEAFEVAARVWANVGLDGESETAVVEPQIKLHLGPIDALAGAIVPLAGELTEPRFFGVRAGVSAHL